MAKMSPVEFTRVTLTDEFWAPRIRTNRDITIDIQHAHLVKTGRIAGIDPNYKPGDPNAHHIFWDSDVAKWIETAGYSLSSHRDPDLEAKIDEVIELFAKCQRADGYLNSWYNAMDPEKRWTNLRDCHELYCAGHLIEAAVAYYLATGKRRLLDIMCRYVDHIDSMFGPEDGKRRGYCGHEELELALVKLFGVTQNKRYLDLASYMVNERGQSPNYFEVEARERGEGDGPWQFGSYEYNQSHLPVREQDRVVGHAVRAMYLYCAMADVAREVEDESLTSALETLWKNVCLKQMYITGGIGPSHANEGFTFDYDMPEESAYCETCATIGLTFWNHRMLQLSGDGRFADVMERALYNGTISGISLSGDRFFYVNPLASMGRHHREEWFGCACCPGNISRLIASIGSYVYSESDDTAWIHLYAQGSGRVRTAGQNVEFRQFTEYPWQGRVEIEVLPETAATFTVAVRIPGWCQSAVLSVDGEAVDLASVVEKGYAMLTRQWKPGERICLAMDMPVELVSANPAVRQAAGKVALQRGPVVYCFEEVDNRMTPLSRISVSRELTISPNHRGDLLGGVTVLECEGLMVSDDTWDGKLYSNEAQLLVPVSLTAVPYCVWDNRAAGQMLVWVRES